MDFTDVVRLVNALLASLVFGALCFKGRLYFHLYDTHQKLLYISFTLYAFATAYGSVEAYNQDVAFGWRILIVLAANIVALVAFAFYRNSAFARPGRIPHR